MKIIRLYRYWWVMFVLLVIAGCSPWIKVPENTQVHSMLDVSIEQLHKQSDQYIGMVFEENFKFFRIYHNREDADLSKKGQVIEGETHFTARPLNQYLHVVRIHITPRQESWLVNEKIERQDVVHARVRFVGIAPGGALAFELLEILGT
ncbi:MAG: hypothetical protein OEY87_07450 [Gammaproteobacteria bacterium]|nr:hypothetical protein [Gammaproteobacteria bacterium]MDH5735942.1 hypothetical protein [Gammaproteobacteria bacterium]